MRGVPQKSPPDLGLYWATRSALAIASAVANVAKLTSRAQRAEENDFVFPVVIGLNEVSLPAASLGIGLAAALDADEFGACHDRMMPRGVAPRKWPKRTGRAVLEEARTGRSTVAQVRSVQSGAAGSSRRLPLASGRRKTGVEPRAGARSPEPTLGGLRCVSRSHHLRCVAPAVAAVEVWCRSSPANEFEVHVQPSAADVTEQPTIAIHLVERGVGLENDTTAERRKSEERSSRGPRVALARAEFGRVDLDEPDSAPISKRERVTVVDRGDDD